MLLAALLLVAGLALPAYAADEGPPVIKLFMGTARVGSGLAPEGALVEGFIGDVKAGQDTVRANGEYSLAVAGHAGDAGKTITFKVAGDLAKETAVFEADPGLPPVTGFDLTIGGGSSLPLPLPFDCFIATAAYGTDTAEEIKVLREFRDAVLMPNRAGAAFVSLYYLVSPPVAEVIARHEFLRTVLRSGLIDPVVAMLKWSHDLWRRGSDEHIDELFPQIESARA